MDVPSPAAGTVKAITVKVGDKVSEGIALMTLEAARLPDSPRRRQRAPPTPRPEAPRPALAAADR